METPTDISFPHPYVRTAFFNFAAPAFQVRGGGQCSLDNYRTLCVPCHAVATKRLAGERAAARLRTGNGASGPADTRRAMARRRAGGRGRGGGCVDMNKDGGDGGGGVDDDVCSVETREMQESEEEGTGRLIESVEFLRGGIVGGGGDSARAVGGNAAIVADEIGLELLECGVTPRSAVMGARGNRDSPSSPPPALPTFSEQGFAAVP